MKKFLPIAMAAVMSMSAVAVSAVSANAVEPLNTPVQYAQVARASLATPKISKAESVYGGVKLTWNKVNGAAKYRVYYKAVKAGHEWSIQLQHHISTRMFHRAGITPIL